MRGKEEEWANDEPQVSGLKSLNRKKIQISKKY